MNPLLPPSAEAAGVFALLEVISDPKKAKAQLDEIAGKQVELKAQIDKLQEGQAFLGRTQDEINRRTTELNAREGSVAQREALAARDAQNVRRQAEEWHAANVQQQQIQKDLAEKEKQVLAHEVALTARENAVQRLEVETKNRAARLAEDEQRFNDRLLKLRQLAAG